MKKPTVSVVIPTHNRCNYLKEAVDSIFAQTYKNWELIIIDDCSEDETWSWLCELRDDRVKKIRLEEHAERSAARNVGLRTARGEFVFFLDDDDLLPVQALKQHTEALEKYPRAVGSIGGYIEFDGKGRKGANRIVRRRTLRNILDDILFGWPATSGQCLFRIDVIKSVKGWDETFAIAEDQHLLLRVARIGPAVLLPDLVLKFRVHGEQWRPFQTWKIATKIRQRAVKKLPLNERQRAGRILQARVDFKQALSHNSQAEPVKALHFFFKSLSADEQVLYRRLARVCATATSFEDKSSRFFRAKTRRFRWAGSQSPA
ncbi:MAG: glycosyltransferase family 2 protein [bacterium]